MYVKSTFDGVSTLPASFIFRYADRANVLTATNAGIGVVAIAAAQNGWVVLSATLIVFSASLDHVDGWVARTYCSSDKEARAFGQHLDTLADVVDFSIAPVVLLSTLSGGSTFAVLAAVFFVLTGIGRLAHFEIVGAEGGRKYIGLPTTYAAYFLCFPLVFNALGILHTSMLSVIFILAGVLQVADITVTKPTYIITLVAMPAIYLVTLTIAFLSL